MSDSEPFIKASQSEKIQNVLLYAGIRTELLLVGTVGSGSVKHETDANKDENYHFKRCAWCFFRRSLVTLYDY